MKTLLLTLLTAASFGTLVPAGRAAHSETPAPAASKASQPPAVRLGLITRTTALTGTKVRDCGDSSVGKMEDVILDLSTGQAVAALFSCGSDLEVTPVPARSFVCATKNRVLVNMDKKTLKGAPVFPRVDLNRPLELSRLSRSFDYFHQGLPEILPAASGRLLSAARIVHQRILSENNEPLGQIEDVVVDLPVGSAVYLLIRPTTAAEAQKILYAVLPQSVQPDTAGQALVLKTDRAHFLAGPHFDAEYWAELSRPEFAAAVQKHYGAQRGATGDSSPASQPTQSRGETANGKGQSVLARSDQEITQAVVTEIVRNDSHFSMRDLRITAANGRVTLSSCVKNEKQKQQLVAAAARVVGPENVDNQLQTLTKK